MHTQLTLWWQGIFNYSVHILHKINKDEVDITQYHEKSSDKILKSLPDTYPAKIWLNFSTHATTTSGPHEYKLKVAGLSREVSFMLTPSVAGIHVQSCIDMKGPIILLCGIVQDTQYAEKRSLEDG